LRDGDRHAALEHDVDLLGPVSVSMSTAFGRAGRMNRTPGRSPAPDVDEGERGDRVMLGAPRAARDLAEGPSHRDRNNSSPRAS